MKLLRFKLIFIILIFTLPTLADDVIEGGVFTEEKSGLPIENLGGKSGESLPSEQFYSSERQANAPVNKTLFVVGDDGVCYYGNFKVLDSRKVLVVYHNSKAPLENCIYQKKLTPDPSGFAIFEKKGGVCKPVYADSIEDMRKDRDGLREINNIVSIAYCTDKTFSFGQHYHPTKVKMAKPEIIVTNVAIEKPELKPEPKPELKPEIKPEVKAEVKPEPKVELKPEPLPTKLPEKKIVQHKAEHKIKAKPKTKLKVLGNKKHKKKIEEKEDTFSFSDWFSKMKTKIGDSYQARFGKKEKPKELEEDELDEDEKDVWDEEPQKMAPKVVKKIPNVKRTQASVKQHYTIQVGAYPTEAEAQKAGEEISTLDDNLEPFHYTAEVNERTWYRVAVGQYDSFKEAKRALTQVKSVTKGAAFIQSIDPKDFPTE